jgi:hypothetical protein
VCFWRNRRSSQRAFHSEHRSHQENGLNRKRIGRSKKITFCSILKRRRFCSSQSIKVQHRSMRHEDATHSKPITCDLQRSIEFQILSPRPILVASVDSILAVQSTSRFQPLVCVLVVSLISEELVPGWGANKHLVARYDGCFGRMHSFVCIKICRSEPGH